MFKWLKSNRQSSGGGPDYSAVDSREKAEALVKRGELQKLLLLPAEFGGEDIPPNIVFVPPFVVELKTESDRNVVLPLAQKGTIKRYQANPTYQDKSLVPISITIVAFDPGSFTTTIAIWGKGLNANLPRA